MSTSMFGAVKTPSNFLAPVVEPIEVARGIIKMVDNGESGVVTAPLYTNWIGWYGVLPASFQKIVRAVVGIDNAVPAGGLKNTAA